MWNAVRSTFCVLFFFVLFFWSAASVEAQSQDTSSPNSDSSVSSTPSAPSTSLSSMTLDEMLTQLENEVKASNADSKTLSEQLTASKTEASAWKSLSQRFEKRYETDMKSALEREAVLLIQNERLTRAVWICAPVAGLTLLGGIVYAFSVLTGH